MTLMLWTLACSSQGSLRDQSHGLPNRIREHQIDTQKFKELILIEICSSFAAPTFIENQLKRLRQILPYVCDLWKSPISKKLNKPSDNYILKYKRIKLLYLARLRKIKNGFSGNKYNCSKKTYRTMRHCIPERNYWFCKMDNYYCYSYIYLDFAR